MLHGCDVESCGKTSAIVVEKGKIYKKGRTYCVAGAPNDVSYTRIINIHRVFLYTTFQRMKLYGQNRCISIVEIKAILLFNVVGLMLRPTFEDGWYEHIPLVKSGEDGWWIQLKIMLLKGPVPRPDTIVPYSFRLKVRKRRIVSFFLLFSYFKCLRCTHTPCLSTWLQLRFSYRKKILW